MIVAEVLLSDNAMSIIGTIIAGSLLATAGAGILLFVRMGTVETKLNGIEDSRAQEHNERTSRQDALDRELEKIYDRQNRQEVAIAKLEAQVEAFTATLSVLNATVSTLAQVLKHRDQDT